MKLTDKAVFRLAALRGDTLPRHTPEWDAFHATVRETSRNERIQAAV